MPWPDWANVSEPPEECRHSLAFNPAHNRCSADRAAVVGLVAMDTDMLPQHPTPQHFQDRLVDILIASKRNSHAQFLNRDLNTPISPILVWLCAPAHTRDYFTRTSRVLHAYFTLLLAYFTPTSRYFTRTSRLLHAYFTRTSRLLHATSCVLHAYFTLLHAYFTPTSRVLHAYFTPTSRYFKRTSRLLHAYFTRT